MLRKNKSNVHLSNKLDSTSFGKCILILEKIDQTNLHRGQEDRGQITLFNYGDHGLTKKKNPKQNLYHNSSLINVKYEPCRLMAKNQKYKMLKVQ